MITKTLFAPALVAVCLLTFAVHHAVAADEKPQVLLLGDSISIGYAKPTVRKLAGIAHVQRPPTNCGPTGRGVEILDAWLADKDWDVIHFNFGLHDIKYLDPTSNRTADPTAAGAHRQTDPATYEANLKTLVERLKATGAQLIWCTTTPVPPGARGMLPEDVLQYNAIAAKVMAAHGVTVNDLYGFALPQLSDIQLDKNVHYTDEGYDVLAGQVASSIAKVIGESGQAQEASEFVHATDESRIERTGEWMAGGDVDGRARNRYSWPLFLRAYEIGNSLALTFDGVGVAVLFHTPRVRAFGSHELDGHMRAQIDDGQPVDIIPHEEPLEVVVADDLPNGTHRVVLTDLARSGTVAGFRVFKKPVGHVQGMIAGDNPNYLFDVRINTFQNGQRVRSTLHRNWVNKWFSVTGLPPGDGYSFHIEALGWSPWQSESIAIKTSQTIDLGTIELKQDPATIRGPIRSPAIGYPAVTIPGQRVAVDCAPADDASLPDAVRLVRHIGKAHISRETALLDAAFTVPADTPPGVYDLQLMTGESPWATAARSVVVRDEYPAESITVMTWGHTDTWGQHQAEFERTLFDIANVVGPDLVLVSNAINPAYISGAASQLAAPYLINFGNHRLRGHEDWFGSQVGMIDMGPNVAVFNFGLQWKHDTSELATMMASRDQVPGRILNTFEADVPIDLLKRYDIRLMHDAHGWLKPRVLIMPDTQTMRVGKVSASSFRVVKMKDYRVVSVSDPIEVKRIADPTIAQVPPAPLRVVHMQTPDGSRQAEVINELPIAVAAARVVFLVPNGDYEAEGAKIESVAISDDRQWAELVTRVAGEVEPGESAQVTLRLRK